MKWTLGSIAALTAVLCSVAPAQAAPSPASPTLDITTSLAGQPLPVSPWSGSWKVTKPGRRASLDVQGLVASGTVTTVRSSWTSAWRWTRRGATAMSASVENDYQDVAGSARENSVEMLVQARLPGKQWQVVQSMVMSHDFELLIPAGFGLGLGIGALRRVRVQWRVRVTATFVDTSSEGLSETVRVA